MRTYSVTQFIFENLLSHLWHSGKESACQWRRWGFDPWVRKMTWRRKRQATTVFLPGKFHGQQSLAGCSPWGGKESDTAEWLSTRVSTIYQFHKYFLCSYLGTRIQHSVPCPLGGCIWYSQPVSECNKENPGVVFFFFWCYCSITFLKLIYS